MNVSDDLKTLEQMIHDISWAPNVAIGTMMKREAEIFSRRLDLYSTDSDKTKFYNALDFALKASNPRADQASLQASVKENWLAYEGAICKRAGLTKIEPTTSLV